MYDKSCQQTYDDLVANHRNVIENRAEEYAQLTVPSVFPIKGTSESTELTNDIQSFGAQAVNHLANKLSMTLFGAQRPFFRLKALPAFIEEMAAANIPEDALSAMFQKAEREALMEVARMGSQEHFTATLLNLIITGNALLHFPKGTDERASVYSIRDYVIKRDLKGFPILIITKDTKRFDAFPTDVQFKILNNAPAVPPDPKREVDLYTKIVWDHTVKKYYTRQYAEGTEITDRPGIDTVDTLEFVPLVWKLVRGEDYGRAYIEDYFGDFHTLSTCEQALTEFIAISAQVKGLVNPAGLTDVAELNRTPNGQWCSGREEDVALLQMNKNNDLQIVEARIARIEQRLSKAFLMDSSGIRDAERVTAEEIRLIARELETSLGGVYTRLAQTFQLPVARLLLQRIEFRIDGKSVEPIILTGLDVLSRSGDLDAYRLFVQDASMLMNLDEEVRRELDLNGILRFLAANNNLDSQMAFLTQEEKDARTEQEQAMQEQAKQDQMEVDTAGQRLEQDQ